MNICFYSETVLPKVGGQELVVDALARELVKQGHAVTVLAPRPRWPLRPRDGELPYRVIRHPRFVSTVRFVSWYARFLRKAHRSNAFDVVHCHGVYPTGWLASLCATDFQKTGTPVVITSHGGDVREGNARLRKPVLVPRHHDAIAAADACIAISEFTADGFRRICPTVRRIKSIPNGVDVAAWATLVHNRPAAIDPSIPAGEYVLFIGRLHSRKGVDVLLDATAQLSDVKIVIAGGGPEESRLREQVEKNEMTNRVWFTGSVQGQTKAWLLQNALLTVVPSRQWEAFPLVVLESWSAGKPVIASSMPGLADLITPGKTGWLFEPGNAADLATVIAGAVDRRDEIRSMADPLLALARTYEWSEIARRHVALYETLRKQKI